MGAMYHDNPSPSASIGQARMWLQASHQLSLVGGIELDSIVSQWGTRLLEVPWIPLASLRLW